MERSKALTSPEKIEIAISTYDFSGKTSDQLAEAYKIAKHTKDDLKKSHPLVPKLNAFEKRLLKEIRAARLSSPAPKSDNKGLE